MVPISTPSRTGSAGDMFLKVKGARCGPIKGESQDTDHKGEIEVLAWSWGMHGVPTLGGGRSAGKASINDLQIVKRVDSASTALMSALRSNEPVDAVLTLRKAGATQLEYFKISIREGRVTSLTIEAGDKGGGADLFEHVSFTYNKITVEYTPQGQDGQGRGGMSFDDQWSPE